MKQEKIHANGFLMYRVEPSQVFEVIDLNSSSGQLMTMSRATAYKIVSARASGLFSLVRKYEQQLLNLDKIEDV